MSIDLWSSSGARSLTAHGGAPPGNPAARAAGITQRIHDLTGGAVDLDGPRELTLRARLNPQPVPPQPGFTLRRAGRMMRCADGWVAAHMPRPSDRELIPALTAGAVSEPGDPTPDGTAFDGLADWLSTQPRDTSLATATLLGFPLVAIPAEPFGARRNARSTAATSRPRILPWTLSDAHTGARTPARSRHRALHVADLSALWAGPLAGAILAEAGAEVTRYESEQRPETTLPADRAFAARLNSRKTPVRLDFNDRHELHHRLAAADVLITSARPRALERLGIHRRPHQLWLRITAYGAHGADAERAGFGDDAAAAAGAIAWHNGHPTFVADALADPLTGLLAGEAALRLTSVGITGTVDLNLRRSASWAIHTPEPPQ